jgi:hypothetical protein
MILLWVISAAALTIAGVIAWRWRDRKVSYPVVSAVFALVVVVGAFTWQADRDNRERDAATAARIAAEQLYRVQLDNYNLEVQAYKDCLGRVNSRLIINTTLTNIFDSFSLIYDLIESSVAGGEHADQLAAGRADIQSKRDIVTTQYAPYPEGYCPPAPPTPPVPPEND